MYLLLLCSCAVLPAVLARPLRDGEIVAADSELSVDVDAAGIGSRSHEQLTSTDGKSYDFLELYHYAGHLIDFAHGIMIFRASELISK